MNGPEVCVGAVIVDADELLLIKRGRGVGAGKWSVPGGRVEAGEAMAEALVREVLEETGLEVVCDELVGWVERIDHDHHFVILDFRASLLDLERRDPKPGDDAEEAAWWPLDQVAELPDLVDGLAEFLHEHGVIETIV